MKHTTELNIDAWVDEIAGANKQEQKQSASYTRNKTNKRKKRDTPGRKEREQRKFRKTNNINAN